MRGQLLEARVCLLVDGFNWVFAARKSVGCGFDDPRRRRRRRENEERQEPETQVSALHRNLSLKLVNFSSCFKKLFFRCRRFLRSDVDLK